MQMVVDDLAAVMGLSGCFDRLFLPLIQALPEDGGEQPGLPGFTKITKQTLHGNWRMIASVVVRADVESRRIRLELLGDLRQRRLSSDRPGLYGMLELGVMLELGHRIKNWDRDPTRALQMFSQGLIESRKLVGESHPTTGFLNLLAETHLDLGNFDRALNYRKEELAALETTEIPRPVLQGHINSIASTSALCGLRRFWMACRSLALELSAGSPS